MLIEYAGCVKSYFTENAFRIPLCRHAYLIRRWSLSACGNRNGSERQKLQHLASLLKVSYAVHFMGERPEGALSDQ